MRLFPGQAAAEVERLEQEPVAPLGAHRPQKGLVGLNVAPAVEAEHILRLAHAPRHAGDVRLHLGHVHHAKDGIADLDAVAVGAAQEVRNGAAARHARQVEDGDLQPLGQGAGAGEAALHRGRQRPPLPRVLAHQDVGGALRQVAQVPFIVVVAQVGHFTQAHQALVGGELHDDVRRAAARLAAGGDGGELDGGDFHGCLPSWPG